MSEIHLANQQKPDIVCLIKNQIIQNNMKKIIVSMHISLDGFVAGLNGEMNWIKFDEELFNFVGTMTNEADTALYGRKTYEMMHNYWPTADQKPNANKHDIEHAKWYKQSQKIVVSTTLNESGLEKTKVIGNNLAENIKKLKQENGKNIIVFGSASVTHFLFNKGLIDEFWLFVNPVVIGSGIPLFKEIKSTVNLKFAGCKQFSCGVAGLHYLK